MKAELAKLTAEKEEEVAKKEAAEKKKKEHERNLKKKSEEHKNLLLEKKRQEQDVEVEKAKNLVKKAPITKGGKPPLNPKNARTPKADNKRKMDEGTTSKKKTKETPKKGTMIGDRPKVGSPESLRTFESPDTTGTFDQVQGVFDNDVTIFDRFFHSKTGVEMVKFKINKTGVSDDKPWFFVKALYPQLFQKFGIANQHLGLDREKWLDESDFETAEYVEMIYDLAEPVDDWHKAKFITIWDNGSLINDTTFAQLQCDELQKLTTFVNNYKGTKFTGPKLERLWIIPQLPFEKYQRMLREEEKKQKTSSAKKKKGKQTPVGSKKRKNQQTPSPSKKTRRNLNDTMDEAAEKAIDDISGKLGNSGTVSYCFGKSGNYFDLVDCLTELLRIRQTRVLMTNMMMSRKMMKKMLLVTRLLRRWVTSTIKTKPNPRMVTYLLHNWKIRTRIFRQKRMFPIPSRLMRKKVHRRNKIPLP